MEGRPLYYEREAPNLIYCDHCLMHDRLVGKGETYVSYGGVLGHPSCVKQYMEAHPIAPPTVAMEVPHHDDVVMAASVALIASDGYGG